MRSLLHHAVQQIKKEKLHNLWTFIFFLILPVIFFTFDKIISVVPTAQADAVVLYPGDANWDDRFVTGSLDLPGSVLASDGTNLFVGGRFDFGGSTKLNNIGYWDGAAWQEMGGGFSDAYGSIYAIAVSGDNVFVGGYFNSVGSNPGVPAKNIAVWSKETKVWSALQNGVNGTVTAIAANSTDIYVSGYFGSAGGIQTNGLARWNIEDSAWYVFEGLGADDSINSIAIDGENVYATGYFNAIGGQPASNAAYWDGADWHAMGSNNLNLNQIATHNGQVFAATDIYEGSYPYITKIMVWDETAWAELDPMPEGYEGDLTSSPDGALTLAITNQQTSQREVYQWNEGTSGFDLFVTLPNGESSQMIFHGANLIVSGDLKNSDNPCAGNLASWDGSQWTRIGTANQTVNGTVLSMVGPSENDLYLGGRFSCINGTNEGLVSHWNGSELSTVGDGLIGDFARLAWDGSKSRLYAAGHFTALENSEVRDVAYLQDGVWTAVGDALDSEGLGVDAIAVSGDTVIIAQHTTTGSGGGQMYALKAGAWQPLGGEADGIINSLAIMGNNIFAAGDFSKIGDVNLNNIARWDGAAWNSLGSGTDSWVKTLAVSGNNLLVGGNYREANGDANLKSLARWDGASWHSIGDLESSVVNKIAIYGNSIYFDNVRLILHLNIFTMTVT